ncbi:hypothetical protein FO488_08740 [Geobacter sp. FeAm09]|uniref:hypothetical protein n=1 Tax=Geobacter sp. FeAm09 TaxID=2597769 RepID=UPI0011EC53AB|nr:hypothetical protein [Geobacter sp. FeAm09]QEM68241.1 hypothetical protein FO488_08740 [Geobacter sp. FeAm09]
MFQKVKNFAVTVYRKAKEHVVAGVTAVTATASAIFGTAEPSHAANATLDPVFAAFDTTGLQANITTILMAGVLILLLFVGYKYLKKAGNRM